MQSLSRGGAVASFATPISQSKRTDLSRAVLAFDLRLRLDAPGFGGSTHENYGDRGAVRCVRLERAADRCRDGRLQRREQHLQFGNLGRFGCN